MTWAGSLPITTLPRARESIPPRDSGTATPPVREQQTEVAGPDQPVPVEIRPASVPPAPVDQDQAEIDPVDSGVPIEVPGAGNDGGSERTRAEPSRHHADERTNRASSGIRDRGRHVGLPRGVRSHEATLPSSCSSTVCARPAATATAGRSGVPIPGGTASWPEVSSPQQRTEPSSRMATEWAEPAAMATTR